MNEILEFLIKFDSLISALIAGIFTFLVTKYNYHKNIPLDKYEKAYNRVYYPIYLLINSDKCISEIVEQSEVYIKKNKKYVDKMTLKTLNYLKENLGRTAEKKAYANFINNIYAMDTKLRKRLGYLEPNIFSVYTYSQPSDRRILRITIEILGAYIPAVFLTYVKDEDIRNALMVVSALFLIVLLIEVLWVILLMIKKLIKKLFSIIMRMIKKVFSKIKLFADCICRKK